MVMMGRGGEGHPYLPLIDYSAKLMSAYRSGGGKMIMSGSIESTSSRALERRHMVITVSQHTHTQVHRLPRGCAWEAHTLVSLSQDQ